MVEGRDIGTVVFPDAEVKVFLEASLDERAARRVSEMRTRGFDVCYSEIRTDIRERGARDEYLFSVNRYCFLAVTGS